MATAVPGGLAVRSLARAWAAQPMAMAQAVGLTIVGLFALPRPPSTLTMTLPWWLHTAWAAAFAVGGLARIFGLCARRVAVDAAGCWLIASAAAVYGTVLLAVSGWRAVAPALIMATIGAAHATAGRKLHRQARDLGERDG